MGLMTREAALALIEGEGEAVLVYVNVCLEPGRDAVPLPIDAEEAARLLREEAPAGAMVHADLDVDSLYLGADPGAEPLDESR